MSIGFVIVTYNSERVLPACLKSIPQGYSAVVVDNASKDSSPEIAKSHGASLIVNAKNLGFGTACNQGARALATSHVFFLNPDAALAPGALGTIEHAITHYPGAGAFGPAVHINGKRQKFRTTSYMENRGQRQASETPPDEAAEVGFLDGAALVCDRELFWKLGGFDERIFLYFEDDDLCFRIKSCGRRLFYIPEAHVLHERTASSGKSLRLDYFRSFHAAKSRIFVSNKHGIPLDIPGEKRHAAVLLLRAMASLNVSKATKTLGMLAALRQPSSPGSPAPQPAGNALQ